MEKKVLKGSVRLSFERKITRKCIHNIIKCTASTNTSMFTVLIAENAGRSILSYALLFSSFAIFRARHLDAARVYTS